MKLVLVRHGESERNIGIFEGIEPHLTERGQKQAFHTGERAGLRSYQALYTSPMSRAMATAAALAATTGLTPIVQRDLCEIREEEQFYGFPRADLERWYPGIPLPDACTEAGWWDGVVESESAMYERARREVAVLRERHGGSDDRILLVTHGGFGSALISVLYGLDPCGIMRFSMHNCAFTRIDFDGDVVRIRKLNCCWHLPLEVRTDFTVAEGSYLANAARRVGGTAQ